MKDEDPNRASPQHRGQTGRHRAPDRDTEAERDHEAERRPDQERSIDEPDHGVAKQVGGEALLRAALGMDEEPPDVGVVEAAQRAVPAAPVIDVRAVRVPGAIGAGVVLSVVCGPGDHGSFDGR